MAINSGSVSYFNETWVIVDNILICIRHSNPNDVTNTSWKIHLIFPWFNDTS